MDRKPSLVFFGTDEFAATVLQKLHEANFDIKAVVTPPDEAAGRKRMLKAPIVKHKAESLKLEVLQPRKLSDPNTLQVLGSKLQDCDLGIVVVYGKIIPGKLLKAPKHGFLNIHPSLLPKYRGPSPIKTAIYNGDAETGVTIIELDSEMDHGDVVVQTKYQISKIKIHEEIRDEMAELGASLLIKIIPDYISGKIKATPQEHEKATHTALLHREDGKVDLKNDSPEIIYNKFRAYHDWPGIWTMHKEKRVKILDCRLVDGKLELLQVQPEGKNPMTYKEYTHGYGTINS